MAGLKDHEGHNREKSPTPPSSPLKQSLNAVKTPPPKPDSGQDFDSEAPTILHSGSAFDAATIIEPSHASEAATMLDAPVRAPSRPAPTPPASNWNASFLLPTGSVLANRYEILDLLGEGGMGAVYKARDNELDRLIALKVIRPELSSNPEILQRFKQELVLARQVTDRNIIRIFDLGEANGIRFITMEYVEGTSLYQILREHGKLGVVESAEIITQVLSGLKAAHREGVIHRDLKPGNIMRDPQGRILVMDFGLARSLESDGMTKTGAVLGTMEYMSPEQAMGAALDQRSDLFTVGLIFFELLTGKMPFKAETALASLLKRVHERAVPISSLDSTIPSAVQQIVAKCLERDPNQRYQTAQEFIDDLQKWEGAGVAASLHFPPVRTWGQDIPWHWIGGIGAILVLAIAGFFLHGRIFKSNTAGPVEKPLSGSAGVSVLVADFQNNTSDTIFDGTLEPMLNVALEGASFINAFNRGTARQLAEKLPNPTSKLDEQAARLVAVDQGISAIVIGSLDLRGNGYELSAKAVDAVTGKVLVTNHITSDNKDQLLLDVPKLAAPIRQALGDNTPESVQLAASQGTFKVSNLEAVHQYSMGMEQYAAGKNDDALKSFSKAVELDPNFARAYAGLAALAGDLGQTQDADKYAKMAMAHIDRMTERERYFVRGMYYVRAGNWQKCVEEYSDLVKKYHSQFGQNNLATCYAQLHNMPRAMEEGRKALELAPKDAAAQLNFALYSCYATQFQSCEQEANEVFKINANYEEAFLALAYAQTGQNQLTEAAGTYQKLQKVSSWGASLGASGLANLAMYQGRFRDAVDTLEKGAAADILAKRPDGAADKFAMLAYVQLSRGEKKAASLAADKALAISQSSKIRFLAARSFTELGDLAKARKLADGLASSLHAEPQAYAKLVSGEIALKQHDSKTALRLFTEANALQDNWLSRFDLGRAYLEAGAFAEADSEFDRCVQRRGEAVELFMDDMPTFSYQPAVYYYEGRVREGLKSPDFAELYRTYVKIRNDSAEDPIVAEIHRRLSK
jgi:serine/threonine protein kinase/tetratricopeptide (TPR) repeat protein